MPFLNVTATAKKRSVHVAAVIIACITSCPLLPQDPAHAERAIRESLSTPPPRALVLADVAVGQNLQQASSVTISGSAADQEVRLVLKSNDPAKVLLSTAPDTKGSESILVNVMAGLGRSPDFYIQALGNSGTVTYTASAPGFGSMTARVTLQPSGFVLLSPKRGERSFRAVRAGTARISVQSALLDPGFNYVGEQQLRGGLSVKLDVKSSDPSVGVITGTPVIIAGGSSGATTDFRGVGDGSCVLEVSVPPGFSTPARLARLDAAVFVPGIAVTDDVRVGRDLEIAGYVNLGALAPPGGVPVTLTSADPAKLLLSDNPRRKGSDCLTITVPAGTVIANYFLQALDSSGTVTYTATAPGYLSRTGTVTLTPSGVVLASPIGLDGPRGFHSMLSTKESPLIGVWLAQLDPVYHSSSDQTTQLLRGGLSLTINIVNSNPAAGTVASPVTIDGGAEYTETHFTPLAIGSTILAVTAPPGFTMSRNQASLNAVVKP